MSPQDPMADASNSTRVTDPRTVVQAHTANQVEHAWAACRTSYMLASTVIGVLVLVKDMPLTFAVAAYLVIAGCVIVGIWMKHMLIYTFGRTVEAAQWLWLAALIATPLIDLMFDI